jgi:hypothetical protein
LPPDFAVEASDRMGLTVIRNLVELSLQGTFTLRRELATPPEPTEAGAGESGAGWTIAEIAFLTPASDALAELEDAARVNA